MNIIPLNENIVLKQIKFDEEMKTEKGLFIPTSSEMRPINYSKVIAVGEDVKNLKSGMTIICDLGRAIKVIDNNEIYWVIDASFVVAVIKDVS